MSDIGEKIAKLRASKGWTLERLGDEVGVGKSTVRKWERGEIKNMRRDKLEAIAKAFNITPEYLLGWEDKKETDPRMIVHSINPVPIFDPISCGTGTWIDERPSEFVGIPADMLSKGDQVYFCNEAEGDSMEPRIHSGDYVVFEKVDQVESGTIGSFSLNGEYYCKRFKRLPDGSAWLFSENAEYDPIPIRPGDDFRILGRYRLRLTKQ